MLKDCFVPYVEYLIPQAQTTVNQLQILCAVTLTSSRDVFEKYIERVPPKMFPFLLQTIIHHSYAKFYTGEITWFSGDSVTSILQFWPYEVLTLREHLTMMNRLVSGKDSRSISLYENQKKYHSFVQELVKFMIQSFIFERNSTAHKKGKKKVHRLDVSRIGVSLEEMILRYSLEASKNEVKKLCKRSKCRPSEVVCDISFTVPERFSEYMSCILPFSAKDQKDSSLITIFDKVTFESLPIFQISEIMSYLNKNVTVNYIEFSLTSLRQDWLVDYIESVSESLEGFRLSYCIPIGLVGKHPGFHLNFLSRLQNLHQLCISGTYTRDGWGILSKLSKDLTYLKMSGCRFFSNDFRNFARHSQSLKQIDLSNNSLQGPAMFTALSYFICNLPNIEIIELDGCKLHEVPLELLESFLHQFLTSCPKLKVLQLLNNDFSSTVLMNSLVSLVEKDSLRLLCLTLPSDAYINARGNGVIRENLNRLKGVFETRVRSFPLSQVRIEWKEPEVSLWFYGV